MKTQSYNTFWQRIHQFAKTQGFPLRVMFELTYRCNFRCRHCYVPNSYRKKSELNKEEVFCILRQLKDIGCLYLGFTGGEPFMRKDILEILRHAKEKGFQLIIYTNGSLINEEIAQELKRLAPNKVDITIPAMSEAAFGRITGLAGSREKVFKAISLLHKNEINLGFKSCVLKGNSSEIEEIQEFSASLGALHRLDDTLSPCLNGSKEPYRYRSQGISNGDLEDCNKKTMGYGLRTTDLFKCGAGKSQAAITPQGELKMCVMIGRPKYKIFDKTTVSQKAGLKKAWERLKETVSSCGPESRRWRAGKI